MDFSVHSWGTRALWGRAHIWRLLPFSLAKKKKKVINTSLSNSQPLALSYTSSRQAFPITPWNLAHPDCQWPPLTPWSILNPYLFNSVTQLPPQQPPPWLLELLSRRASVTSTASLFSATRGGLVLLLCSLSQHSLPVSCLYTAWQSDHPSLFLQPKPLSQAQLLISPVSDSEP